MANYYLVKKLNEWGQITTTSYKVVEQLQEYFDNKLEVRFDKDQNVYYVYN